MNKKNNQALFDRLKHSKSLPTLPHILLKIIDMCNREDANFKDLSGIIENDPALTMKILQMINSPYFNLPNRVINLEKALVLIGIDAVRNIALCASVHQVFKTEVASSHFSLKKFWGHSLLCALVARALAQRIRYPNPDEAFLAGLLHDAGKLVFLANLPQEYDSALSSAKGNTERLLSEEAKLGALHSEVGSWLMTEWNLPSQMSDAVLYHHEPLYRISDSFSLVKLVFVANVLSHGNGAATETKIEAAEAVFGFSKGDVDPLMNQAMRELSVVARSLDIDVEMEQEKTSGADDRKKQDLLNQEIKNISILLGTLQAMLKAVDEESLVEIFYQALQILFGLKTFIFFKYDYERDLLIGKGGGSQNVNLPSLLVPYNESQSLLVKALKKGSVLSSFDVPADTEPSIIDEQIKRRMKMDGIIYFPLITHRSKVGVLVIGSNTNEAQIISKRKKQMILLINQVALALHTDNLRKIQRRQLHSERMEASSEMARRVVHEANNPLSIIRNYITVLDKKLAKDTDIAENLRVLKEEIDRVSRLLGELSEFSIPAPQEPETTNVNSTISDLMALSRETLLAGISVKLSLDKNLLPIRIQRDRLKQIVLNLIKNAAEAMGSTGSLTIVTKLLTYFPLNEVPEIAIDTVGGEGFLQIIVGDSGPGIPETLRLSLFEPFVTTKGKEHPGIGLSVVYNTVKALGGTISLQTRKGEGTRFTLIFPIPSHTPVKRLP